MVQLDFYCGDLVMDDDKLESFFPLSDDFRSHDAPFYWIGRLNARYGADLDAILKPQGLSASKWRVLMILHEHGRLSMSDISTHTVAKLSTLTKIVYKMKGDGLVSVSLSNRDGRVTEVELTQLGEERLEEARKLTHPLVDKAYRGISPEEVRSLNLSLSKIFNNLKSI